MRLPVFFCCCCWTAMTVLPDGWKIAWRKFWCTSHTTYLWLSCLCIYGSNNHNLKLFLVYPQGGNCQLQCAQFSNHGQLGNYVYTPSCFQTLVGHNLKTRYAPSVQCYGNAIWSLAIVAECFFLFFFILWKVMSQNGQRQHDIAISYYLTCAYMVKIIQ